MAFSYNSKLFGGIGSGGGGLGSSYASTTDTTTFTGPIVAKNITATGLATPVITPPVSPVLSLLTTITVVAGASLVDGDYFTLSDGSAVVYEFDNDATVTPGRVGITFTGAESATEIRDLVIIAINGSTLQATAVAAAADTLTVTSDLAGDTMGVNSENVANAGFLVPAWSEPVHVTTYGYKVVAYLPDGTSTAASAEVQTVLGHATLSAANYNAVTWGAVTGASSYRLYRTTGTPAGGDAPPRLLYTGALVNFSDTNAASTSETPATVDGTGVVTGDRLVGVAALGNVSTVAAGTSTAAGRIGGVLSVSTTSVATSGTAEEVLATYTLPANALTSTGSMVRVRTWGVTAANTNNKTLRVRFGGIGGTIVYTKLATTSAADCYAMVDIIRTGAETQVAAGFGTIATSPGVTVSAPTQTLANAIDIVVTGQTPTSAGDMTVGGLIVDVLN